MKNKNVYAKQSMPYVILLLVIVGSLVFFRLSQYEVHDLSYDKFMTELQNGEVKKIEITPKNGAGVYYITGSLDGYKSTETFTVNIPLSEGVLDKVMKYVDEDNIEVKTNTNPENNGLLTVVVNVVPIVLLGIMALWLFSRINGSNKNSMDFGRSKAKLNEEAKAHFKDVAGLVEEKEEVAELIDFLKNPKKFQKLGARIPKGVLLVGPPGTGKTLLAKAVAGEANVPFYYISGSDFVELFVGVGASRVRDMFKQAKQSAPCLIFIDEIDAVGRQRGAGMGGGNDEREQTLNQLLVEMDGFDENINIIVLAATNRPDILDTALLRPGRFDRQIYVQAPDIMGREQILEVHAKNKPLAADVDLKVLAKRTPGFTGADLKNLLNEAALLAARNNQEQIVMQNIDDAIDKIVAGAEKKSRIITDEEKEITAYHEVGHALLHYFTDNSDPLHKVSIIPRGNALGVTWSLPEHDKSLYKYSDLKDRIITALGGRIAEELIYDGQITSGATADIKQATDIARKMVTVYGMSAKMGTVAYGKSGENVFMGRDFGQTKNYSEETAREIDDEVRAIIEDCYNYGKKALGDNVDLIKAVTAELLERETLEEKEVSEIIERVREARNENKEC